MAPQISTELNARFSKVKLLLCDVDGVLTDGTVFVGSGTEFKRFSILDGLGMVTLREQGGRIGWISSRPSSATVIRAHQLNIDFIHQAKGSKVAAVNAILAKTGCTWEEVCFVGDDIVDLGPITRAGVGVAVANAVPEVKAAACHVTHKTGGEGAVREVVELILKAQGKWASVIDSHTATSEQ